MILSIIAAVARNGAIGYKNKLLYRLKGDMKRFKELTTNHTIIMGKNTFLSAKGCASQQKKHSAYKKG